MPFFLLFFGVIFMVTAVRGTQGDLFKLLKEDFAGTNNFFVWVLAIVIIVLAGNIRQIKPISDAFLGLVILVIIVANYGRGKDLIGSFVDQVKQGTS